MYPALLSSTQKNKKENRNDSSNYRGTSIISTISYLHMKKPLTFHRSRIIRPRNWRTGKFSIGPLLDWSYFKFNTINWKESRTMLRCVFGICYTIVICLHQIKYFDLLIEETERCIFICRPYKNVWYKTYRDSGLVIS